MIFANYNYQSCIKMSRSFIFKPENFFLQKPKKWQNIIFGPMYCWDSFVSGLLGPLLLIGRRVWGWFFPKTFQGLHFLSSVLLSWRIAIWTICSWNKIEEKAQCDSEQDQYKLFLRSAQFLSWTIPIAFYVLQNLVYRLCCWCAQKFCK